MYKILVVDDDKNIIEVLKYNLVKEGYAVSTAEDGIKALELARKEKPDLIILDIMLPGLDGFELCRIIRKERSVPIVILTAKTEEIDKVVGLELGADDYMTKPFSVRELMARVKATLRRSQWIESQKTAVSEAVPDVIKTDGIEIDVGGHRVFRRGELLKLSPKEFDLLLFLVHHRGQVFNRERLVENVWGYDYGGTERTVDVHVRSLRLKIEDNPEKPVNLLTVHGFGYKYEDC
ncbi:MAG TPA: response regulator transcription factor [Dehalococcoidales bacterium]|nr:response regulator transcription factor [Dehalococcoidales bacterium]